MPLFDENLNMWMWHWAGMLATEKLLGRMNAPKNIICPPFLTTRWLLCKQFVCGSLTAFCSKSWPPKILFSRAKTTHSIFQHFDRWNATNAHPLAEIHRTYKQYSSTTLNVIFEGCGQKKCLEPKASNLEPHGWFALRTSLYTCYIYLCYNNGRLLHALLDGWGSLHLEHFRTS